MSTFRIVSVAPYYENQTQLKTTTQELRGATLRIQPEPGLTTQWLQFRVERAVGSARERAWNSPLAVSGVRAHVSTVPDAFLVTIVARDKSAGSEVLRRAQRLHLSRPVPTTAPAQPNIPVS
jgi:hypothetical protein